MVAIGRNMYFFLANKYHHLAIIYSCVLTEVTSPCSMNCVASWRTYFEDNSNVTDRNKQKIHILL